MKKVILAFTLILISASCFTGYYKKVNEQFPKPQLVEGKMHEKQEYEEDISICVDKTKWFESEEKEEIYRAIGGGPSFDSELLLVSATITNTAATAQDVNISQCYVETMGWANGVNQLLYSNYNSESASIIITLKENESKSIVLPYLILSNAFQKEEWDKIKTRTFFLTYSIYPTKNAIRLMQN